MQKRREKRRPKRLKVLYGDGRFNNIGFTTNVSKNGMFIVTKGSRFFNHEIDMMVAVDDQVFRLRGEVVWRMQSPVPGKQGKLREGMGVKIIEAPAEYLNFVEYIKYEQSPIRFI